jgi:hypothetical protein
MKKAFVALVAAATLAGSVIAFSGEAEASKSGRALTYGILGGVAAGALIAGGAAAAPGYYAPPPPPRAYYYDEPACRVVRERFWDGYAWRSRRVQVCD